MVSFHRDFMLHCATNGTVTILAHFVSSSLISNHQQMKNWPLDKQTATCFNKNIHMEIIRRTKHIEFNSICSRVWNNVLNFHYH